MLYFNHQTYLHRFVEKEGGKYGRDYNKAKDIKKWKNMNP